MKNTPESVADLRSRMKSDAAEEFRNVVEGMGRPLRVVPIEMAEDYMEWQQDVGSARSYTEALRLVREAGYRVLFKGGMHETSPDDKPDFYITVHPPRD